MNGEKARTHKVIKIVARCFAVLIVIAIAAALLLWNRWVNKNSLLCAYDTPAGQEVYILGTLHTNHFNRLADYSMEDVLSVVENTAPDAVFIEARQQTFEESGTVDGPVDMCVVYAYCKDKDIPVELIDWWQIDNDFQENTTDTERDDHIFENISSALEKQSTDSRILVVCGSGHYYEQQKRLKAADCIKRALENKSDYFAAADEPFAYPASASEVWEGRARFYAYVNPEIVKADPTLTAAIKDSFWSWDHDAYYKQQMEYCEMFKANELYR